MVFLEMELKTTRRLLLLVAFLICAACACGVHLSESFFAGPSKHPLPLEVKPADAGELLPRLAAKGVASASYDPDSLRILVSLEDEKKAVIVLAEEKLLSEAYKYGFHKMLARWSLEGWPDDGFSGFDGEARVRECEARLRASIVSGLNGEARLIESMDGIAEAAVFYRQEHELIRSATSVSGDLSYRGSPHIAAVKVRLERETPLDEKTANAIIAIVTAAGSPDPRDVVIADQFGNKFRSRYGHSYYSASRRLFLAADKKRWDAEFAHSEPLRRKLEDFVRFHVPNIQYEGGVDVFIHCEPHFDAGKAAAKSEPGIKSVSIVIHQPFRLKRDGGRKRRSEERDDMARDPETRDPVWRRESVGNSRHIKEALTPRIAMLIGVASADIYNKIWVHEIPWSPIRPFNACDRLTETDGE